MMKCARSIGLVATVIASLIAPGVSTPAAAAPSQHLNWGSNLSSGSDSCPPGSLVINVKQRVLNDIDSGEQANYWAFDDFVRSIQVVEVSAGAFCATVKYQGQFTTVEGPAPGKTDAVGVGVVGTFEGGYVSTIFSRQGCRAQLSAPWGT